MREILSISIFLVAFFALLEIATESAPSFGLRVLLAGAIIGVLAFSTLGIVVGILGAGTLANVIASTGITISLMIFLNTKLVVIEKLPIVLAIPISAIIATLIIYVLIRVMK